MKHTILLADIGGTNSRFAVAQPGGRPEHIAVLANNDFARAESAIAHFLQQTNTKPTAGVLAIAGPIDGDEVALTNRAWRFRLTELGRAFDLSPLAALNDFEAIAWAVPGLSAADLRVVGPVLPPGPGPKVVCGPGTGLGAAALVPLRGDWHVVPGEAGHCSFGPASRDEEEVFARLREATGHVSAETILSGPGILRLHAALHPGGAPLSSEAILARAAAGDVAARSTVATFVRLLGRFAGDLALTFKATGGVYLTGGLGCGLGELLDAALFRRAFEAHPPYQALLAAMPTFVITDPQPGLLGCSVYAKHMLREESIVRVPSS
jgi:glucokinase